MVLLFWSVIKLASDVCKREYPVLYADRTACRNELHLKLCLLISDNVLACGGFVYKMRVVRNCTLYFN